MKKRLFYLCIGLCLIVFITCSKKDNKPAFPPGKSITQSTPLPPPPPVCTSNCALTYLPGYYADIIPQNYDNFFGDDLVGLLSGHTDPYGVHYDGQMNLINCAGQLQGACWTINYADSFYYNSQNKLQTILIHKTYDIPGQTCTLYPLNHYHWMDRCDIAYGQHFKSLGGNVLVVVQTATVTLSRSDTVAMGQPVHSFTPSGEVFYYEYINKQLVFKRHTPDSQFPGAPTEFTYTYDANGNMATIDMSLQGGTLIRHIYFASYDTQKGIMSSNPTWQLLTSNYSLNNPTNWYINSTNHWQAVYSNYSNCFPHHVKYLNATIGSEDFDLFYLCQ